MLRRSSLFAITSVVAALTALAVPQAAVAQTKAATTTEGITIVLPLNAIGASREASVKSMQAIAAAIHKQPGLIDEVLMENKNTSTKPTHVHVMRWREQKNWDSAAANPELQKVLAANIANVQVVDSASVYVPVK